MKFLTGTYNTMAELKTAYRKLANIHHPDHGGKTADFQDLVSEYESLLKVFTLKEQIEKAMQEQIRKEQEKKRKEKEWQEACKKQASRIRPRSMQMTFDMWTRKQYA